MFDTSKYIKEIIKSCLIQAKLPDVAISLEHPTDAAFGDYSTNIAMSIFSQLQAAKNGEMMSTAIDEAAMANPRALAAFLVDRLLHSPTYDPNIISEITIAGPGFINFKLAANYLHKVTQEMAMDPVSALLPNIGQGRPMVVEYSSPNIAKPFTIGHLRSTIIGDSVANIFEALGWDVKRDNHLGDWGTQFGKQIYAIKQLGKGNEAANIAAISQSTNPVKELVELYVEFHTQAETHPEMEDAAREWFQKLESGDSEARRLWQMCIDWSLLEFKKIYARLGVKFTENPANGYMGYGESFFEDKMGMVVAELTEKKLLTEGKEGARLVFFPDDQYPPLMIIKKDGATLYATRDLATDKWRLTHYGSGVKVINEVGAEQAMYFQQLYLLEQMLGWYQAGQRIHVKHGLYRFKDKKMSTRKGNVIWLEEVLDEADTRAAALAQSKQASREVPAQITNLSQISIGALKWNDLKRSSHLDVVFDWDEIINLKGNSGPYMQYTYVRCHSILAKAAAAHIDIKTAIAKPIDTLSTSLETTELAVMRQLNQFSEVVQLAANEYAPHYICTYLYQLAQSFNAFYTQCSVLGKEVSPDTQAFRLQLTQATAQVLAKGLGLLGIPVITEM